MTAKKGIGGTGIALDSVMGLVLIGFGIALTAVGVVNGGIWLLLLLLGLPLLALGIGCFVLAMKNRL